MPELVVRLFLFSKELAFSMRAVLLDKVKKLTGVLGYGFVG